MEGCVSYFMKTRIVMAKAQTRGLSAKAYQSLRGHVDSHLSAHLRAPHFEHISQIQKKMAGADQGDRAHRVLQQLNIFTASLSAAARAGMDELKPGGWVLLVESSTGLRAQVEVQKANGSYTVVRTVTGPLADALARIVIGSIKTSKAMEFRILSVPALHVFGVWIHHPKRPQKDLFIPTMTNFIGLRPPRKYGRAIVQRLLRRQGNAMILRWYEQHQERRQPQND